MKLKCLVLPSEEIQCLCSHSKFLEERNTEVPLSQATSRGPITIGICGCLCGASDSWGFPSLAEETAVSLKRECSSYLLWYHKSPPNLVASNKNHLLSLSVPLCQEFGSSSAGWFRLDVTHGIAVRLWLEVASSQRLLHLSGP